MSGYRFGRFEADLQRRTLLGNGRPIVLAFRHFEALRALLEAEGAIVGRDDLHRRLWPDAIVDETSLNKAMSQLRKALAEHDPANEYIETVPKHGYRFTAPLVRMEAPRPDAGRRRKAVVGRTALALALLAAAAVGWLAWQREALRERVDSVRAEGMKLHRNRDYAHAAERFKEAIAMDPSRGEPYGELAHSVHRMGAAGTDATPVIELAQKGVDMDPDCATCRGTLGFFLFYHDWQWERAEAEYEAALRLDPANSGIRPSYGYLLAATGRTAEAQRHMDYAAEADPLVAGRHSARAAALYVNRRYDDAVAAADRAIALDRTQIDAWDYRSRAQLMLGKNEDAVRSMIAERYKDRSQEVSAAVEQGGGEAGLRKLLEITGGWSDRSTYCWRRAAWFAALAEDAAALGEIEEALRTRNVNLMLVAVDPLYERLHGDARFERVLEEMGLTAAGRRVSALRGHAGGKP